MLISNCPPDIGGWNEAGDAFVINDAERFSQEIIPTVYKHNNWNSFIRQLNDYGFKKLKTQIPSAHMFQHPYFHRDQRNQLSSITRRKKSYGKELEICILHAINMEIL